MELVMKNDSHYTLVSGTISLETEPYDCIMKVAHESPKGNILST